MPYLYPTMTEFQALLAQYEECLTDPDIPEDARHDTLEGIFSQVQLAGDKLEASLLDYARMRTELAAEEEALRGLAARYTAKARLKAGFVERMDALAIKALQARGGDEKIKVAGTTVAVGYTEAVEIRCDVLDLPEEFQRIRVEPAKDALKKAIKAGADIKGVELRRNAGLRVR